MKRATAAIAMLIATFGASTWWALESGGVAIIVTRTPAGGIRSTHVWFTEPDGRLWLEAGTPENAWFQDVGGNPALRFSVNGRSASYLARPLEDPSAHGRIRALMRDKYGFRDRWVGLMADTSRSVAVELSPAEE